MFFFWRSPAMFSVSFHLVAVLDRVHVAQINKHSCTARPAERLNTVFDGESRASTHQSATQP